MSFSFNIINDLVLESERTAPGSRAAYCNEVDWHALACLIIFQ